MSQDLKTNGRKAAEYIVTLAGVSWFLAWLFRWPFPMSTFGILFWFIGPAVLAVVFIGFSVYYFRRIFTLGERHSRLAQSIVVAAISTTITVPLSITISRALWEPYNYGPGP